MSKEVYLMVDAEGDAVPLEQRKAFCDFILNKLKAAVENGKSALAILQNWIIESAYFTNIQLSEVTFRYERKFDEANSRLLHKFIFSKKKAKVVNYKPKKEGSND